MLKPCSRFLPGRLKVLRLQEITHILGNPNFRYHFHNRPPPVPILSHMNPLHAHPSHSLKIDFSIILPSTPRSSRQSPSSTLAHQVPVWTSVCHAPFILRPFYPNWSYYQKICSGECKSLNFSLYSSLDHPDSSFLFDRIVFLTSLLLNTLSPDSSLGMKKQD